MKHLLFLIISSIATLASAGNLVMVPLNPGINLIKEEWDLIGDRLPDLETSYFRTFNLNDYLSKPLSGVTWQISNEPTGVTLYSNGNLESYPDVTSAGDHLVTVTAILGGDVKSKVYSLKIGSHFLKVSKIRGGGGHTCAIVDEGRVLCWGNGLNGKLGSESGANSLTPVEVVGISGAIDLSVGREHACAVLSSGVASCWGANSTNQIGSPGLTGAAWVPIAVNGLTSVKSISAGYSHTCALLADGTVWCWGANSYGQLGNGSFTSSGSPVRANLPNTVKKVSAGDGFTCALYEIGEVKCFGNNSYGQLGETSGGTVEGISSAIDIAAGFEQACAVLSDGSIRCWGRNQYGQLGDGTFANRSTPIEVTGINNASEVSTSFYFTCARLQNGEARCWGRNNNGQLGDYSTTTRNQPVSAGLSSVQSISAATGGTQSCALLAHGEAQCWGSNTNGKLGDRTQVDRRYPVTVLKVPES